MKWNQQGKSGFHQVLVSDKRLCHSKENYKTLKMPFIWTWTAGNEACKQFGKIFDEKIVTAKNTFRNAGEYEYVWTSFKYITENETVINLNNNTAFSSEYY